jgi:hypothetical protein
MIGYIYKITNPSINISYIGSTIKTIEQRLKKHITNYKEYLKGKYNHCRVFDLFRNNGVPICYIELIEAVEIDTIQELKRLEGQHIQALTLTNNICNKNIAGRSLKEYYQDNKQKYKEYYISNKDKIIQYQHTYSTNNKEKISNYHKRYYQNKKQNNNNTNINSIPDTTMINSHP